MAAFVVVVWDNQGNRSEPAQAGSHAEALTNARQYRTLSYRTVKIGRLGNTIDHWSRSEHLPNNHWTRRATADEWFA